MRRFIHHHHLLKYSGVLCAPCFRLMYTSSHSILFSLQPTTRSMNIIIWRTKLCKSSSTLPHRTSTESCFSTMIFDSPAEDDHGARGLGMRVPEHLKLPRFTCHCNSTLEVKTHTELCRKLKPFRPRSVCSTQLNSTPLHCFADSNGKKTWRMEVVRHFWHHPYVSISGCNLYCGNWWANNYFGT